MTILIIEDDLKIAKLLSDGLEREGYAIDLAHDGEEGLSKAGVNDYDAIILDIMLPKIGGVEVCRKLRQMEVKAPVIVITGLDSLEAKIEALDAGADDYLTKPFSFNELLARLRAVLRREKTVKTTKLQVADLLLDPATHEVTRAGREIRLSPKEYRLLHYMLRRPGYVCTRSMLGEHVWGYNFQINSNVIDAYISHLRKKIDQDFYPKLIQTIPGVGYKIQDKTLPRTRQTKPVPPAAPQL
jgi:DNA-binding response OmpR family regulator